MNFLWEGAREGYLFSKKRYPSLIRSPASRETTRFPRRGKLLFFPDQNKRRALVILTRGVIADDLTQLLVGEGHVVALAEDVAREVVRVDDHRAHAGLLIDLVAHARGIFRNTDAVVAVDGEHVGVEAVEARDLHADHIVEDAVLAGELAKARADGGPEDLPRAALVDGELHLAHLAHADAGAVVLDGKVALAYPDAYAVEARLLKEKLSALYGLEVVDKAPVTIALETLADKAKAVNDEYYDMVIDSDRIKISAATPHGVFNGTQTLLAMLKGKEAPYRLDAMSVEDYPDLLYRGQMIDIARNFTTVDNLKKLVDVFASYKMNVLHFHFSDDEAWRLEIPGLEELTAVGSRRGHTTDESRCLYPCYDGGYDPDAATVGNGYYSREDFIGLLRYAAERHIRVIPEIESPGHARAAIVSMKARYNKYKDTDVEKAAEYLLSEPEDTSRYASVQYYTDNVINVAMPSTYRFMEKVIQELAAMYREAGVPLATVHLGGDEVARGVWLGSPKCQALMKEKGMTKPHDLAEHFITQMADIMQRNGLKFSGWQEVALGHTEEAHRQLRTQAAGVYCWNTVPGYDEVVYQIANNGYPVILCNVGNFYMDMAYNGHPDERGLDWGGYVDESVSFSMLPFSIYRSLRTDGAGNPVDLDAAEKGKTVLTAEGRKNILGVQGQLFAETIRSFNGVEYLLFPKIMGLAERGWNAYPAWEELRGAQEQQAFNKALALYYEKISDMEMPYWARNGINFRLPHPGLLVKDGKLYANVAIRGAEIRYTTDGSEPDAQSALWEAPVPCHAPVVKAKTFCQGKESLPITLKTE